MQKITGAANPKIKYACSLKKANRRESDYLLAEGLRLCADAAQNGVEISMCFVSEKLLNNPQCTGILERAGQQYIIEEHLCAKLSDTKNPQGIFCVCKRPALEHTLDVNGKYLFLEEIRDPGNFGTIMRTAEAFGLSGMIVSGCCDAFSPKVMRASMGAVFRFPILEVSEKRAFLERAQQSGMQLFCSVTDPQAEDVSILSRVSGGMIVAVGNEANGLSAALCASGTRITIHMRGRAESFNASQAATVMMYEMAK